MTDNVLDPGYDGAIEAMSKIHCPQGWVAFPRVAELTSPPTTPTSALTQVAAKIWGDDLKHPPKTFKDLTTYLDKNPKAPLPIPTFGTARHYHGSLEVLMHWRAWKLTTHIKSKIGFDAWGLAEVCDNMQKQIDTQYGAVLPEAVLGKWKKYIDAEVNARVGLFLSSRN